MFSCTKACEAQSLGSGPASPLLLLPLQTRWPDSDVTKIIRPQGPYFDALALFRAGKLDEADLRAQQITRANPTQVDAMHLRALIATRRNDFGTAIAIMQRALAIKPQDAVMLSSLGAMHIATGDPVRALSRFIAATKVDPSFSEAHNGAGTALLLQGRFIEAESHFRAILAAKAENLEALLGLAEALEGQARAGESAEIARKAIAIAPDNVMAHVRLARALDQLSDFDGCVAAHKQAMALTDKAPQTWFGLVISLSAFGRIAEAEAECRALITAFPDFAPAHVRLAALVSKSSDVEIGELQRLASHPGLSERERIQTFFALGAAHEGRGDFDKAFARYQAGNQQARAQTPYSVDKTKAEFAAIKNGFTSQTFTRFKGTGSPDPMPVFVFGMPRSGTTLVEQILCSHPDIDGANELEAVPRLFGKLFEMTGTRMPGEALAKATPAQFAKLGETYLDELRGHSSGRRYVVDKLPGNFLYLGFIALILPQASLLHCRRDPLDTCVSIYKTRFVHGSVPYGYEMTELGHYYRLYDDLMAYWQKVLPKKPVTVSYEQLVAEPKSQTERLLSGLGLDWTEECGRFYQSARSVHSASMAQVRRPIYSSSVGAAERFESALDPLRRVLAEK